MMALVGKEKKPIGSYWEERIPKASVLILLQEDQSVCECHIPSRKKEVLQMIT